MPIRTDSYIKSLFAPRAHRRFAYLSILGLLALGFDLGALQGLSPALLGTSSCQAQAKQPAVAAKVPVRLGAVLPLVGNLASYGSLIRQGSELAEKDLLAQGVDIKYTPENAPFSGQEVITAYRKLVTVDKIQALAGNFSNVALLSLANEFNKTKTPAMHTAAMDDQILAASKGWIFSTNTRVQDEAEALAKYAYDSGARDAAVITIQTNFGEAYRKFFVEKFKALGGKIVADESYQLTDSDYRSQVVRIKQKSPDILMGATFGHFLGLALKQAREAGITCPFISVYESEDQSVLDAAGGYAEGLRYFVSYDPRPGTKTEAFRKRFKETYGIEPGTFALNSYDATMLLADGIQACKADATCLKDYLLKVKDYEGVSGKLSINPDGSANKQFYLREIKAGAFVNVEVK
jgi:branched-chain amino acid transport system substrate-binding protein